MLLTRETLPETIPDIAALDELLCRPSQALIDDLRTIDGDIMILGVAGKMGPTLAGLAKAALPDRKIIGEYSKGMRKRVAMAASLIHHPELFLMDEPFEGVDAMGARLMKDILLDQVKRGATIFLTTHVLEVVERLCERVAIIDRRYIGGSCPNIACLPSKNVIHSARVASYFRRGPEFGIATQGWKIDMSAVRDRKRKMVDGLIELHRSKFKASGAEIVMGNGRFIAPRTIEVTLSAGGTRALRGKTVIINTGSRARLDDMAP